jgi:hypothetical protein
MEFINLDTNYSTTTDSFNANFNLSNPLRKVENIYLKSVELPIGFTNVRTNFNSFVINLSLSPTSPSFGPATITLANKNYTDINSLLTDINTALAARNTNLLFRLNSNNLVEIVRTGIINKYYFTSSNLLNIILGFTNSAYLSTVILTTETVTVTANRQPNLNFDNYISLFIKNIPHKSSSSNQLISFKIPLNSSGNIVYFNSENVSFSQYITITDKNLVVDKLQIVVYDRFGNQLTNNGYDYSLTIGFSFY